MLQEGVPDLLLLREAHLLLLGAADHHGVARILEHVQVSRVVLVNYVTLRLGRIGFSGDLGAAGLVAFRRVSLALSVGAVRSLRALAALCLLRGSLDLWLVHGVLQCQVPVLWSL